MSTMPQDVFTAWVAMFRELSQKLYELDGFNIIRTDNNGIMWCKDEATGDTTWLEPFTSYMAYCAIPRHKMVVDCGKDDVVVITFDINSTLNTIVEQIADSPDVDHALHVAILKAVIKIKEHQREMV